MRKAPGTIFKEDFMAINPGEGEISQDFNIHAEDYHVEDYIKAAEQGDGESQFKLALCYQNGIPQDYAKAIEWFKKALEARTKEHGKKSTYTAEANYFIAECYKNLKEFEEALFFYKSTLPVYMKEYGKDHFLYTDTLALIDECNKKMRS
jgi:TPR repeat protein